MTTIPEPPAEPICVGGCSPPPPPPPVLFVPAVAVALVKVA